MIKHYSEVDLSNTTGIPENVTVPTKMLIHMLEWLDSCEAPEDINDRAALMDEVSR